jgi:hypothetical protein
VVEVAVINVYFVVGVVGGIDQIARRGLLVIAKALYEAPESGLLTAMMALGFDCGAQPLIVPSSLANMKIEGPSLYVELRRSVENDSRRRAARPILRGRNDDLERARDAAAAVESRPA